MQPRQLAVIVAACLILCSCRSTQPASTGSRPLNTWAGEPAVQPSSMSAELARPPQSTPIRPVTYEMPVMPMPAATPLPCPADCVWCADGAWRPPGIAGVWPQDEYLCDGGDREAQVQVARSFDVYGIDPEDTVAHYDTLDGQTNVQASNRVCLYAPRFAAVRQVTSATVNKQQDKLAGVEQPVLPSSQELRIGDRSVSQPVQIEGNKGLLAPHGFRERDLAAVAEDVRFLQGIDHDVLPFEDLAIVRRGVFDASEKSRLAEAVIAAKTWTANEALEILIDGKPAFESVGTTNAQEAVVFDMPEGKPRLRICKLASTQYASPGTIVDFTIRFDNVGDQPIGNVTILDSLTPRLEYVADSAKCTLDADFMTVEPSDGSFILRWEIKPPLDVGKGGVIRFQCRVR
jgi:uncharacterized repeat protein (TIGR01451 family)